MKELLGKFIKEIYISENKTVLAFIEYDFPHNCLVYISIGDCCSETWFESILNPEYLTSGYNIISDIKVKEMVPCCTGKCDSCRDIDLMANNFCISEYGY